MYYEDTEHMPSTYAEFESRAIAKVEFTGQMARELLKDAGVKNISKMRADELRALAREKIPGEVDAALRAHARLFRWPVAHGLAISYGELESLEAAAGVEPTYEGGFARGEYRSLGDVEKVYAAHAACPLATATERARLTCRRGETESAKAVAEALSRIFCVGPIRQHGMRAGDGVALYFDVKAPLQDQCKHEKENGDEQESRTA